MDITKTHNKIYTTKNFNAQTVNYLSVNSMIFLIFIVLKQSLKYIFDLQANISVLISFIFALLLSYLLEKKFVFTTNVKNTTPKQLLFLLFRCCVDFGFYKIADFVFSNLLEMGSAFVFLFTFLMLLFFNFQFDKLLVFNCNYHDDGRTNKLYNTIFENRYIIISGFVTLICLVVIYFINEAFPFGDTTVLRMDLYHQYGPLFTEFYDRVINHESFLYSWTSGGGSSFLGNYFNYLASPLSFIIFLFDRNQIAFAITTLVAIKCILSSMTFTYFIKKSLNRSSFASSAFGVMYAFCAYFLAYYWNIMWLEGMILLPIIILGIETIINTGKPWIYITSLSILFLSNYYIGFMMCIFAVLYFICYFAITHSLTDKIDNIIDIYEKNTFKYITNNCFIGRGLRFASASVISALLVAFALIPVYFILQSCSATSDTFPTSAKSYFDILDFLSSHLAGLETTIRSSGDNVLPNVYSGILTCLLVPAFVANKKIRVKEKFGYISLLLILFASFNNNYLNYLWHAFHFPNDLPYRFSFMYTFILLIIGFKALMHIKSLAVKDYAFIGLGWVFIITMMQKFETNKMSDFTIYVSLAFIIIWTGLIIVIRNGKQDKLIIGLLTITLAFGESVIVAMNDIAFTQKNSDYISNYETYTDAINHINESDDSFYRTELSNLNTRMDPCLYNYRGISTFSSMAYESYSGNQFSLGMYGNRINSYTYNPQTPIYNMMYSIKYIIDKEKNMSPYEYDYKYTTDDGNASVYENRYFLPIAYNVSSDIENWIVEESNPFEQQANFIEKATGISDIFIPVRYNSMESDKITCDEVISNGTYFFTKDNGDSKEGNVKLSISPTNDSDVFVYINAPKVESVNYTWNNEECKENQQLKTPYIYSLGEHKADDKIDISIECGTSTEDSSYFDIYAYTIDMDKLNAAYEFLQLGAMNIDKFDNTSVLGTINAGFNGCLYTSIPYDNGWTVTVDGEKTDTFKIADSQLGIYINEGEHNIEFNYQPKGLMVGCVISAITLICLICYYLVSKRRNLSKLNKNCNEDDLNLLS